MSPQKRKQHTQMLISFEIKFDESQKFERRKKDVQDNKNSIGRGTLRTFFSFRVNKRSRHKFHSCLGTMSYNAFPLPSLSTFTAQLFSVQRQGQLKRLRTCQHRHLYPSILLISDTLRSILKESQTARQEKAQWLCSVPTFPLFCIIAFGSEAVI